MAGALTELENCTLGVIRQRQPCSTYAVRQEFARSLTPEWSGSTGSIYPVVERLLRLDLIQVESQAGDRRGRRNLSLTPAGERALADWITGLEPWAGRATPDPIRTRINFLDRLEKDADRAACLSRAEALTRQMADELREQIAAEPEARVGDRVSRLGALYQLEARLKWLNEARAAFGLAEAR